MDTWRSVISLKLKNIGYFDFLPWIHTLACNVAGRFSDVSQPVKCGRFTEGGEGVTPRLAFGVRLVPGVSQWQRCHHHRALWRLGIRHLVRRDGAFYGNENRHVIRRMRCLLQQSVAVQCTSQYLLNISTSSWNMLWCEMVIVIRDKTGTLTWRRILQKHQ